ncbi:DNA polymerase III subunit chi, partial [Klebsiella pneumoniae]|uniref:DNA polymerase III subunit chi n=1 Tax=Klebsiella pneumoniae TaxID=573 RepID=UPI0034DEC835
MALAETVASVVRVDFYELSGRFDDPLFVACVLVGRAWPKAASVAIVAPAAQLKALDDRLWQEPQGRFLPHGIDQ